jgi:arginase
MKNNQLNMLGLPFDDKSTFMKGTAKAPEKIRKILHDGASNYMSESGIEIKPEVNLIDQGNLIITDYHQIAKQITQKVDLRIPTVFLGGDHSITFPITQAMHEVHEKFDILHFDAHADIYDHFEGDKYSHACPFARIMEAGFVNRLVSVGMRNMTPHLNEQADKFGVEIILMKDVDKHKAFDFRNPLYISIDLDALDPAFAPGVSHHEPGGFSSRQLIQLLHKIETPIIGADIVELNPDRDPSEITAALAAKLLKELCGLIIRNG